MQFGEVSMVMLILQMGRVRKGRSVARKILSTKDGFSEITPELHVSFLDHHFSDEHIYILCSIHEIFQITALICSALNKIKLF